jgi:predicted ATPase/DNA-binding XRE family transcriptional regulator
MTHSPSSPPTSVTDLGLLLRRHRREAGLTQEELAERAGISARAVSDIERGLRTTVYRDTADRLSKALALDELERAELLRASRRSPVQEPLRLPPLPPTPFQGRDQQLEELDDLVLGRSPGLVTLTGPPGVGKSRLALELAHRLAPRLSGAWFVPLAPVGTAGAVPSAVLRVLELPDAGDPAETILRHLPSRALLILDNFEHVLEAAGWLGDLLARAGDLRVLATSRAPLRLRPEIEFPVEPLDDAAALELFRERTDAVARGLAWREGELVLARRICARLDRLPLALELGAAALSHLTLSSLDQGLEAHLDVLGEGWRDMPERHRSMEAAVTWSVHLLAPADRELLLSLSVFAGTFGVDAVAAVAALEEAVALRRLGRLVEHSVVRLAGELRGWPRYQLFEVVRQSERGRAREQEKLELFQERHLDHFLKLAEAAEPELHRASRGEWFERLSSDSDNLEAALAYAEEREDADRGLRLATALWRWWRQRGQLNSGRAHFRRLLALPAGSLGVRARALWGASWLAMHQQDADEARRLSQELLELSARAGDPLVRRNALTGLGMVARHEGRYAEALPMFQETVELARAASDPWILATSIFNVGQPLVELGRFREAEQALEDARQRYEGLGDSAFAARTLLYQARAAILRGDAVRAAGLIVKAAETFSELEEPWGKIECLEVGAACLAMRALNEAAAAGMAAAQTAHARLGSAQLRADSVLLEGVFAAAHERAGDVAWDEATGSGQQMSLEEALEEVLEGLRPAS